MQFRTEINAIEGYRGMICHGHPLLLVGSCFSDNIGNRLMRDLFETTVNPLGPLYNPLSILRAFELMAATDEMPRRFCKSDGKWLSYDAHSRISAPTEDGLSASLTAGLDRMRLTLTKTATVIVTLGTTRVFRLKADNVTVANCHKQPGNIFDESHLGLSDTIAALDRIVRLIRGFYDSINIIFTVSPLRYPGHDPHANTLSKSLLHLAIHEVAGRFDRITYFPAYEIMMDDLRDYRFYADDMRHPSDKAVEYIYEKFAGSFFDDNTMELASSARRLTRRLGHRSATPSDPSSWPEYSIIPTNPKLLTAYQQYLANGI